jgi:hypothetical protein
MHHENEYGVPIPSAELQERVRRVDPAIQLRAFYWGRNEIRWAAQYAWPENDPRRARIQSGELDPAKAWDIICYAPLDCSPDEFVGLLDRGLTAMGVGNQKGYVVELLAKVAAENRKVAADRWAKVSDDALELMDTHASLVSPDIIRQSGISVPGMGPESRPKKRKGKAA